MEALVVAIIIGEFVAGYYIGSQSVDERAYGVLVSWSNYVGDLIHQGRAPGE